VAVPLAALLLLATFSYAHDDRERESDRHGNRPPQVPADLQVPAGNELQFRVKGVGVQIYVWTQSATNPTLFSWVFKAPHAVLIHHEENIVGIHYAGPTWQSNDGSKVVGARIAGITVDPTAVPWLLLGVTSNVGTGVLTETTYIQRVNTAGGLAPFAPGIIAGQEALVPYTADYYFYRAQ